MVRTIRDKVGSGDYSSNSEVIREVLRNWMHQSESLLILIYNGTVTDFCNINIFRKVK